MNRRIQRHVSSREGYARWADEYDAFPNPMTAMAAHVLARAAPELAGLDVIELGCGTGRNAGALTGLVASYLGVDDSPEMLAIARQRAAPRARFEQRDLRAGLRIAPASFDVVLISLVLEHFDDAAPVFAAARDVARPGALLLAIELHAGLRERGVGAHVETTGETLVLPSFAHTADELAAVATVTGWAPETATDWYATPALERAHPKLERHRGRPVVLELRARLDAGEPAGTSKPGES